MTAIGLPKRTSAAQARQIENQKSRMVLRALSNAYPHAVSASNLMKLAGFGSIAPGAFISFCIARARINQAIGFLGWRVSRSGGTINDLCRLEARKKGQ